MSDGTLTVSAAEPLQLGHAERVAGGEHGRDLPHHRVRDLAVLLHPGQQLQQAGVGDQEAADAAVHAAQHVVDRVPQLP